LERLDSLQSLESLERLERLQSLERLGMLESLERMQRLERLEKLESLEKFNKSYLDLDIPIWDIIYCDPPYEWTNWYKIWEFNSNEFREWAEEKSKTNPIYISSYKWREWWLSYNTWKWSIMAPNWFQDNDDKKEKIFYNKMK